MNLKLIGTVRNFFREYTTDDMKEVIEKMKVVIKEKEEDEIKISSKVKELEEVRLNVISELKLLGEEIPNSLKTQVTISNYLKSKKTKKSAKKRVQYALEVNGKVRKWNGLNKKPDWFKEAIASGYTTNEMIENAKKLVE